MTYSHPCPGCEQREQRIAEMEEEIQAARAAIAPHGGSLVERITEVLADQGRCSQRIAELEAENNRLRNLLVECDIFLRLHAGPQNQLKADVQAALAGGE
jgi:hypothetical protein